jgi:hypothetical protein
MLVAPMTSTGVRIIRSADGIAVGEFSNVCIVIWRDAVTRPRFDVQAAGLAEVVARHREGAVFVCVVEPTAAPPDDALRRASVEMIRSHESALRCIACVVEGSGFRNAITRSVLSAMALLFRSRLVPLSIFDTPPAAAKWVGPRMEAQDPSALVRAIEEVREAISVRHG